MIENLINMIFMLIFTCPVLVYLIVKKQKLFWSNIKVISIVIFLGIVYGMIADSAAIHIGIWSFYENKILGYKIGLMPIEDLIFAILITCIVSFVTLILYERKGL